MRYSARQLVHLAAVVEAKSITLAAQNLGLTQPALTKSIHLLEARVGAQLLRRTTSGAEPTYLGQTLAIHGSSISASERRASKDIDDWVSARKGRLLIGASATMMECLMPSVLSAFLRERPDVFLKLHVSSLDTLSLKLVSNVIDLYLGIMNLQQTPADVVAHPLYEDELAIFLREGHPLLGTRNISMKDLSQQSWIVLSENKIIRRMVDAALLSAGLPTMRRVMEVDSFVGQLNVVRSTDFISMLPRKMLGRQNGVVAVPLRDIIPRTNRCFSVGIFHRSTDELSSLAREFIQEVGTILPAIVEEVPS